MRVGQVPAIEQQPRTVADTATHYGYVAYKEIFVGDRRVQPPHSQYYKTLPSRELIPFTNTDVPEPKESLIASAGFAHATLSRPKDGRDPSVTIVQRTAKECSREIETAYDEWGFKTLYPLTGYSIEDAFEVFRTIQPFTYKLADILNALDEAEGRIEAFGTVTVSYGDDEYSFEALRDDLKPVAREVLPIIRESAERGVNLAEDIKNNTVQKMEQFYATGTGKKNADPHDHYIFKEMDEQIPKLLGKKAEAPVYGESQESIALRKKEIELRERELAVREAEIETARRNREKMEAVRAARKTK